MGGLWRGPAPVLFFPESGFTSCLFLPQTGSQQSLQMGSAMD